MVKYYSYFQVTDKQLSHRKMNNIPEIKRLVRAGDSNQAFCSIVCFSNQLAILLPYWEDATQCIKLNVKVRTSGYPYTDF